jgi:hypothetical protein
MRIQCEKVGARQSGAGRICRPAAAAADPRCARRPPQVTLVHSDAACNHHTEAFKSVAAEVVLHEGPRGGPALVLALPKRGELVLPLRPPLALYAQRLAAGHLGLRLPEYRPAAGGVKSLQVTLSVGADDAPELARFRAALGAALAGGRRPLAARSLNARPGAEAAVFTAALGGRAAPAAAADLASLEELPAPSAEQAAALALVRQGRSVFLTGCAGTGKSLLLAHALRALPSDSTFVTATTALAASQLGGCTLHSFAGVGRGEGPPAALAAAGARGEAGARWRRVAVLVIDEVSMLDGDFLDLIDLAARRARGDDRPFGGVQLVLCGDFHQLPPVGPRGAPRRFAFEAAAWRALAPETVELTTVFRQRDAEFVALLAAVRAGAAAPGGPATARVAAALRAAAAAEPFPDDGVLPTRLLTHCGDVDAENEAALVALPGAEVRFAARDVGDARSLAAGCPAPSSLALKVGAQVMLIKNISAKRGLVNGARGVVERFTSAGLPVVRFAASGVSEAVPRERWAVRVGGAETAARLQVPLKLAWAVTVHKSQGLTLDRVEVSLDRAFEPGMAYVALSRARALRGLRVVGGVAPAALRADPRVLAFYAAAAAGGGLGGAGATFAGAFGR